MGSHNHTRKSVRSLVTLLPNIIAQCSFPCPTRTDGPHEGLRMEDRSTPYPEESDGSQGLCQAIDKLPDDVLLDIFDFYLENDNSACEPRDTDEWHTLVHVCQRWRKVVFASPRRLNLSLLCGAKTPVRAMLDIWPALPMEIESHWRGNSGWEVGLDNIIAALEHRDRVRSITLLNFPSFLRKKLEAAMQVPFPELTCLRIWWNGYVLVRLDSIFGGSASAPRLRILQLKGIQLQAATVLNLLLSASDLVDLDLWNTNTPYFDSEYISPESMVACLSSLNRLETLHLGFNSPQYRPCPPSQTRIVLPALSYLAFEGENKYSEDLVARIDTPRLSRFTMLFYMGSVSDISQLKQFIGRAKGLKPFKAAKVVFGRLSIQLELDQPHGSVLRIGCIGINRQVPSMALVCSQLSPFVSLIERLDLILIYPHFDLQTEDTAESTQFLDLVRPFTAIQSLYVPERLVPLVVPALQGWIGERATEVLPNLRDLFLGGTTISGTIRRAIQPLLAARQLSSQPIAIHLWEEGSAGWDSSVMSAFPYQYQRT
ncbi:hypothetical protein BC826DRAFT_1106068 [Russula brevipes]|nr:hypothetical protein BC826DRAFT_1106068 [Russula brevipes]